MHEVIIKMNKMSAKRGDNTQTFKIAIKDLADYTGYQGDLAVLDSKEDTVILGKFTLDPDPELGFSVTITPEQTKSLEVGTYTVVFEVLKIVDLVVVFRREISWTLKLLLSLINT